MANYSDYIIALDLDETLLNSDGKISENTLHTLARCKALGFVVVISTACGYGSCAKFAETISADFVCCQAGNMIVDSTKGIVYKNPFSKSELTNFIDHFSKYTNNFTVDSDYALFGGLDDDFAHSWGVTYMETESLKSLNAYKICVGYDESFRQEIMDYCKNHGYICRKMRSRNLMIVTPANSDKYYALEQLMKNLNTNTSKLIVFGDDTSDMLSIEKAGFGIAMANSRQEVLNVARFTTLSNDDDGVAEFLKKHFDI